jgi:Arc/MetJ-type ribon-helix-helix transcriptional regulator
MNIAIGPETQKLLEQQMRRGGYSDPDALVRFALETLGSVDGESFENLNPDVQTAILTAEAQSAHGESRPWKTVREELRARFLAN